MTTNNDLVNVEGASEGRVGLALPRASVDELEQGEAARGGGEREEVGALRANTATGLEGLKTI